MKKESKDLKKLIPESKVSRIGSALLVLLLIAFVGITREPGRLYKVDRIIDGDTIEIEGGQKVRYIGIDAPETVHPSKTVACFGKEAAEKNKELVEGKMVKLEKDVSETDKYGRLLRYVYVEGLFVNDYLVRQGYATVYTTPPDIKYQDLFFESERAARDNKRGLWTSCSSN